MTATSQPYRSNPAMAGMVLCGGQSDRMGTDKAWLPWADHTLLEHMVSILRAFCKPVAVVHAPGQRLPDLTADIILVEDSISNQGPLRGLHSGLSHLPNDQGLVFVTPCDTPGICPGMARMLQEFLGDHDAAVFRTPLGLIPIPGLYRTKIIDIVDQLLSAEQRSLQTLLGAINITTIGSQLLSAHGLSESCLANLNTPEEYRAFPARDGSN